MHPSGACRILPLRCRARPTGNGRAAQIPELGHEALGERVTAAGLVEVQDTTASVRFAPASSRVSGCNPCGSPTHEREAVGGRYRLPEGRRLAGGSDRHAPPLWGVGRRRPTPRLRGHRFVSRSSGGDGSARSSLMSATSSPLLASAPRATGRRMIGGPAQTVAYSSGVATRSGDRASRAHAPALSRSSAIRG